MKKILLTLLLGVLWCVPSYAVEVRPDKAVTVSFDENWDAADNSKNIDGISCGTVWYVHDDDITGTGTTFAGVIESSADGQTWATEVTLNDGASGSLTRGRHYFRINPSTSPGSGEVAATIFRCQEDFLTSEPTGDEIPVALASLEQIAVKPVGMTRVYLDPAGDDANSGLRPDDAWKTWQKVSDIFDEIQCGLEVILVDGGDWDTDAEMGTGCAAGATNCWMDSLTTDCPNEDDIALYIHPENRAARATVDFTSITNDFGDDVFFNNGTAGTGWVVVEGVNVVAAPGDGVSCEQQGKTMFINGNVAVTGDNNNVLTTHQTCEAWGFNITGSAAAATTIAQPIAAVNSSFSGVFTNGGLSADGVSGNDSCIIASDDSDVVVWGAHCSQVDATVNYYAAYANANSSGTTAIKMAHVSIDASNGGIKQGWRAQANGTNETANITGYNVTITSSGNADLITDTPGAPPGTGSSVLLECYDCVLGAHGTSYAIHIDDTNDRTILKGTYLVDDADSTNTFNFEATNYETVDAAQTAADARTGWDVTFTDSNVAEQWGSNPALRCDKDNDCFENSSTNFTLTMETDTGLGCIPSWVLGTSSDICSVSSNRAVSNNGR